MGMSTVKILSILEAASIEPPKARAIAQSFESAFKDQEEPLSKNWMTKADELNLGTQLRAEMKTMEAGLRSEIKTSVAELRAEMSAFKAEIIKWMFLFWIGQIAVMTAIIKFLVQ
jgi:hypothetical protein